MLWPAAFDENSTAWVLLRRLFLCLRLLVAPVAGSPAGGRVRVFLTFVWSFVARPLVVPGSSSGVLGPSVGLQFPVLPGVWETYRSSSYEVMDPVFLLPTSGRSFIGGTSMGSCPLLWLTAVSLAFGLVFAVISVSGGVPRGYCWSPGFPSLGCGGRLQLIYP